MPYSIETDLCSDNGLRLTLGYLMPRARTGATITYGEIANNLRRDLKLTGKIFPTHIGTVVGTLMDKDQTDVTVRRTARERGLDKVREYQRYVEQDPTFQVLMKNPFSIAIPGGALYRNLRTLDYDFQIST